MKILLRILPALFSLSVAAKAPMIDEPAHWAVPLRVVLPAFPEGVTHLPVVVEARVKLKDSGRLDVVSAIQSEPKTPVIEEALLAVLPKWTFAQSYDRDCTPVATASTVKVWFDMKDGKPEVSVSRAPKMPAGVPGPLKEVNADEVRAALRQHYPREARRQSEPADVYARLDVDPRTGQTLKVQIMSLGGSNQLLKHADGPSGDTLPRAQTLASQYANAAYHALMKLRFEPDAARGDAPVKMCRTVNFRIGESR